MKKSALPRKVRRCHKRFQSLIHFALSQGWDVKITGSGELWLIRPGGGTVHSGSVLLKMQETGGYDGR